MGGLLNLWPDEAVAVRLCWRPNLLPGGSVAFFQAIDLEADPD